MKIGSGKICLFAWKIGAAPYGLEKWHKVLENHSVTAIKIMEEPENRNTAWLIKGEHRNSPLPIISIVTPTFNQGKYIEQAIKSVLDQNYPNLQYIIIDGGSTDDTVNIIKKYEQYLTYWVSEKDSGQPNAINKGLKHCTGEIFNWLNSDDYLQSGALYKIANAFKSDVDMVAGKVRLFENDQTIEIVHHQYLSAKGLMNWLPGVKFVQPGVWMKKDLINKCGGINENLHYAFDWDLYIRYLSRFSKVSYLDDLIIHFRYHNQSKTVSMQQKFREEEWKIIEMLSQQHDDRTLKKLADNKIELRRWIPFLSSVTINKTSTKAAKVKMIVSAISNKNLMHWRATLGALRIILNQ